MSAHSVQYGTTEIQLEVIYAPRKTLGISVHPDLGVTVKAPEGTPFEEIEARVLKRAPWILKQQKDFERYLPHLPPRQYVSGETHRYLGRQYRLKVVASDTGVIESDTGVIESENGTAESVNRDGNFVYVYATDKTDTAHVRDLLDDWYLEHARRIFRERLDACFPKMEHAGIPYPQVTIRAMRTRWGSCSPKGRITLNVKLIMVPTFYIDYVIFHELCHLAEPHHSPGYYALLDRVLPDWRERRDKLNSFEFG
jgi:predicted metal-dependent hydrolase